ncbi:MAG: A/G-specific adenine glycosylase [Acidimicrobiia bacterium]
MSEVMLHQTQVPRVEGAWLDFIARFPTPQAMADAGPGAVIEAWGRLGYPRRARRLWDSAVRIAENGWPDDLTDLPGVGRYTANAVRTQADGSDLPAVEVNIRRVVERVNGRRLTDREAEAAMIDVGSPMLGRDRLLALMDVGARLCRPHEPRCTECPLEARCATRGPLEGVTGPRQAPFEGSFRQQRGAVLARLRAGPTPVALLDTRALHSLVTDGLATIEGETAKLP